MSREQIAAIVTAENADQVGEDLDTAVGALEDQFDPKAPAGPGSSPAK